MSNPNIAYTSQEILGEGSTGAVLGTTEITVVEITDQFRLKNSQLTLYLTTLLGTHTSVEYRFYYANQAGGSYFPVVKQDISTNAISDYAAIVSGTLLNIVLEFGLGSCFAFKITAKGVGGANGTASAKVMARDN